MCVGACIHAGVACAFLRRTMGHANEEIESEIGCAKNNKNNNKKARAYSGDFCRLQRGITLLSLSFDQGYFIGDLTLQYLAVFLSVLFNTEFHNCGNGVNDNTLLKGSTF